MTIEQQIQETVALAKELALPAFKAFSETGNIPVQNKAQADRIIEQRAQRHNGLGRSDVERMRAANVHAFLVGEAFMRAPSPGKALAALFG